MILSYMRKTIEIPEGYEARIEGNKVILEPKESEDEKVRKRLIEWVEEFRKLNPTNADHNAECSEALAWLEKQGEQKPILPWRYKKDNTPLLRDSLILNKYGCVAKSPSGAIVSDVWVMDYDELAKLPKEFDKQGSQNLANSAKTCKDEPKFKVGDVIVEIKPNGCCLPVRIKYVDEGAYSCKSDDGKRFLTFPIISQDEYKLVEQNPAWSEDDEKMCQETIDWFEKKCFPYALESENPARESIKWLKSLKERYTWKPSDEHYELEEFAKIVRGNLTGIRNDVQEKFEAKYLQLTGNKMYGGYKD